MRLHKSVAVALAGLMALSVAACSKSSGGGSGDTIKIGVAGSFTGDYAVWGQASLKGAQLAADEINAKGGVLGKKIELVQLDDKADSKEAATVAQKVVSEKQIVAVVGHIFSSTTLAAGPIYDKGKIPAVAVLASNPKVPLIGDYIFRININDAIVGTEMAKYVVQKMGKKRIATIMDQTDYNQGLYDSFAKTAKALGAEIVSVQKFVGNQDKDFAVMLTTIKQANPDSIFVNAYHTEGGLITQQAKSLGIDASLLVLPDSSATPDYLKLAGSAAEGATLFAYFDRSIPDPKIQELVKKYEEKYKEEAFTTVPFAYDALNTIAEAIKKAGKTDGPAIQAALAATSGLQGVTGTITFDKDGDRPTGWNVVLKVQGGKFKVVELTNK